MTEIPRGILDSIEVDPYKFWEREFEDLKKKNDTSFRFVSDMGVRRPIGYTVGAMEQESTSMLE